MPTKARKELGRAEASLSFFPSVCLKDVKTLQTYKREGFSGPKHGHAGQATCPFLTRSPCSTGVLLTGQASGNNTTQECREGVCIAWEDQEVGHPLIPTHDSECSG